ncbi:phosphotransferase [Stackebrandtia soli]|uniref:phosphotransferase n=1 Tax=Stackebrandtia soli TaxID=1892856 RepID=UPI0039EA08F3
MPEPTRTRYLALAPHRGGLITAGTTVPTVEAPDLGSALTALRGHGVDAPLLRPSVSIPGDDTTPRVVVLEFDTAEHSDAPTVPFENLPDLDLPAPVTDRALQLAEEHRTGVIPHQRPTWARPGWHHAFVTWMRDAAAAAGATTVGDPRPVQHWALSAVWRLDTGEGAFYAKAIYGHPAHDDAPAHGFWHEPALTSLLSTEHGQGVPETVAVDTDRGWILMRDMRVTTFGDRTDEPAAPALTALADIQRHWAGRTADLTAVGCPDRRPSILYEQARELASDDDALAEALPTIHRLCERLEHGPIPLSLMHGDYHDQNVGVRDDGVVVAYDWSDGAIGHPFLDVGVFLHRRAETERADLAAAYRDRWRDYADAIALRDLFDIASVLSCLNQVVTSRDLAAGVEPDDRDPFVRGQAHALSLFFAALDEWRAAHPEDRPGGP